MPNKYEDFLNAQTAPPPPAAVQPPAASAQTRLGVAANTPPQAGADAIKYGPPMGLDPDVALDMPQAQVKNQADQERDAQILQQNPQVAHFVAASQANATVAKDSIPQLDSISQWINNHPIPGLSGAWEGYSPLKSLDEPLQDADLALRGDAAVRAEQRKAFASGDVAKGLDLGQQRLQTSLGALFAPVSSLMNLVGDPTGRAIATVPFMRPPGKTPVQAAQAWSGLAESMAGLAEGGAAFKPEPFGPILGKGRVPLTPEGNHPTNDLNFVVDKKGDPYVFKNKYDAAGWASTNIKETGQNFEIGVHPETGLAGIREVPSVDNLGRPEEAPPAPQAALPAPEEEETPFETHSVPETIAEGNHDTVKSLEDLLTETPMHQHSPEAMTEFLDQKGLGDATVYVDKDALAKVFEEDKHDEALNQLITNHLYASGGSLWEDTSKPVALPLSQYLTTVAGKPYADELRKATSFGEPGQSVAQTEPAESMDLSHLPEQPAGAPGTGVVPADPEKLVNWTKVGEKPGGSQPGAVYHDQRGAGWLVKGADEPNPDRARNEVLASKLMGLANIPHPDMKLVDLGDEHGGGLGVASRMEYLEQAHARDLDLKKRAQQQFAVHAWLGNRDVIGTGTSIGGSDNSGALVHVDKESTHTDFFHFDPGGALRYRAQGKEKTDFNGEVSEWEGLRNEKLNPHAHAWFGDMTPLQLQHSAMKLLDIPDSSIEKEVMASGVKDPEALIKTLLERKYMILAKAGVDAPLVEDKPEATVLKTMAAKVEGAVETINAERGLDKLFTSSKALGMTKPRYERHANAVEQAFEDLKARILQRIVNRLRTTYKTQYNEAFAHHLKAVTDESLNRPLIKAQYSLRFTQQGEMKELTENNAFAPGGKPIDFYHGSHALDIGATREERIAMGLDPNYSNPLFKPFKWNIISFSTSPRFVENFKNIEVPSEHGAGHGGVVYIVHLIADKIGDFRNAEDVDKAAKWLKANSPDYGYIGLEALKEKLRQGYYPAWENIDLQKAMGWKGSYMKESVYNPPDPYINANVQDGNQVVFKYRLPQDAVKLKLATSEKAKYPGLQLPNNIFAKEGVTADQVAQQFGLGSGQELLEQTAEIEAQRGKTPFRKWHNDEIQKEAHQRTVEQVGNLIDPERIMEDAREEYDEPGLDTLLIKQLQDLRQQLDGGKIDVGDIKAQAQDAFDALPVKQATNVKLFVAASQKSNTALADNLQNGKPIAAFQSAQEALINHYQTRMALDAQKAVKKIISRWQSLGKRAIIDTMDHNVAAVIHSELEKLGIKVQRDPGELQRFLSQAPLKSGEDLYRQMFLDGFAISYSQLEPEATKANKDNWQETSWGNLQTLKDMLNGMAKYGQTLDRINTVAGDIDFRQWLENVQKRADFLGEHTSVEQIREYMENTKKGLAAKLGERAKAFILSNFPPTMYLHYLDHEEYGPVQAGFLDPIHDALGMLGHLQQGFSDAMKPHTETLRGLNQDLSPHGTDAALMAEQVTGKNYPVIRNRGNLFRAFLHLGSQTARAKMLKGFGWGEEQEAWLKAQMKPEEVALAKAFWDHNENLFQLADKMYMDTRGYGLKKDEPLPVTMPNGETLAGGHLHIQYNRFLQAELKLNEQDKFPAGVSSDFAVNAPVDLMAHQFMQKMPSAFYENERTHYVGPVSLDHNALAQGVKEVIHDIAMRPALTQAQKIAKSAVFQRAVQSAIGPQYESMISPWLSSMAGRPTVPKQEAAAAAIINGLRNNMIFAHLAGRIMAPVKHFVLGLSHDIGTVGVNNIPSLVAGRIKSTKPEWRDFILQNSPILAEGSKGLELNARQLSDEQGMVPSQADKARQAAMYLFTMFRHMQGMGLWMTMYDQAMEDVADHERARSIANRSVAEAQGSGSAAYTPAIAQQTDSLMGAIGNMGYQLMSFRNVSAQRLWIVSREARLALGKAQQGDWESATAAGLNATNKVVFYDILPFITMALLTTLVIGTVTADDKKKKRTVAQRLEHNLETSAVDETLGVFAGGNWVTEGMEYGEGGNSVATAAAHLKQDLGQPHKTSVAQERAIVDGMKAVGPLIGLPDQMTIAGQFAWDQMHQQNLQPGERTLPSTLQRSPLVGRAPRFIPSIPERGRGGRRGR